MTCGSCPSGYAKTGVTSAPGICKEGDPTLVECVPLGTMNLMAVCGSCPDGYREIGSSSVPARCGSADGGHMSQCQLEKFENILPDLKGAVASAHRTVSANCRRRAKEPFHPRRITGPRRRRKNERGRSQGFVSELTP